MNMSVEELITELSMTYSFKMHLILEGDDDRKFFQAALKGKDKVNLICVWGADNVMHVIREVDKIKIASAFIPSLGIIDRDYRIPLGMLLQSPNLIFSDIRDLECMMFNSPSFDAVLTEFGSDNKIAAFGGHGNIAKAARASGAAIGALRYHAQQTKISTSFQKMELSRLVHRKSLSIDPDELVAHLNARQGITGCALPAKVVNLAKETCSKARCDKGLEYFQHDLLLCRGHDLMEILAIGFRSLFGSRSAAESSRENVETLFRLSYIAHFRATPMAKAIENWLAANGLAPQIALV